MFTNFFEPLRNVLRIYLKSVLACTLLIFISSSLTYSLSTAQLLEVFLLVSAREFTDFSESSLFALDMAYHSPLSSKEKSLEENHAVSKLLQPFENLLCNRERVDFLSPEANQNVSNSSNIIVKHLYI